MDNLEKQLNKEIFHEKDSMSALSMIKVQFDKFLHSEVLQPSNYDGRHVREIFKVYTRLEAQFFKDMITEYMESIEKCIVERALHEQEIKKGNKSSTSGNKSTKLVNECSERSNSGNDTDIRPSYDTEPMTEVPNTADYKVFAIEKQHIEQPDFINDTYVMEKNNSNVTSDSTDMSHNVKKVDQHTRKHENERVLLASSIEKLKADIEENKEIHKDLKKVNIRISQILKEKEPQKKDFKSKEDKDSDKMIALGNQVKFLNDIVYKTGQYAQTVFVLTSKPRSYYNGKCSISFANPEYLKKAQWEKLCIYNFQYDKNDLVNIFALGSEETIRLAEANTVSNAFIFEEALKKEICEDLKYVQSLEKKVDEFETQKAKFLNEYDLLVQECLLNDIICTILRSFDDIDEYSEMACKYLEKVKKCERFEMDLSKSHKQKHDTSFA
ncbi:hypothetical protein Tco_0987983 [Tanacetum coccineum]|uniref:Uncharacterized protein n=1 Tax=Tanacetum coccineum TaxID=301880 RepID=A0ABQ5EQ25_9ASTR